jgi:hypothetical protein
MKKPEQEIANFLSAEDVTVIEAIVAKVTAQGFVPHADLLHEFGDRQTTRALALLHKTYRFLVESREPWDGKEVAGFKRAEGRFSQAQLKKIPPQLSFIVQLAASKNNKYSEFKMIAVKCHWTNPVLGGVPKTTPLVQENGKATGGEQINAFERDWLGNVIAAQRFNVRKMMEQAFLLCNREGYAAFRLGYGTVVLDKNHVKIAEHIRGVTKDRQGLGTCKSEMVPAGTEFVLKFAVPASYISPADLLHVLKVAGEMVGLSPGRSAGYGDFVIDEVL